MLIVSCMQEQVHFSATQKLCVKTAKCKSSFLNKRLNNDKSISQKNKCDNLDKM